MFDFDFDELGSSDDAQEAVANVTEEPSKMSVRQLKEALASAGLSCAGAAEREDLVQLLTKARVQAPQVAAAAATPTSAAAPALAKRGSATKPKEPKRRAAPAQRNRGVVDELAVLAAQEAQQAAERQAAVLARMGSSAARPPWTAAAAPPWTAAAARPQAVQAQQAAQCPAWEAPSAARAAATPLREPPPAARPPATPAAAQRQAEQHRQPAPRAPAAHAVATQPAPAPPAPPPARQVLERPQPRVGAPRGSAAARAAAAGEKAVELWTDIDRRRVEQAEPPPAGERGSPAGPPPMRFAVEARAPVRSAPGPSAPVSGGCMPGQTLMGIEETFDGWVRLADDAGWVFRGDCADGPALLPLGDLRAALAEPELSPAPGLQMFEVVGEEGVPVLREAAEDALALGRRSFGEFVLAEAQSYHGWLRLADGGGWAPCSTPQGARLLLRVRPDELQLAVPGTGSAWPDAAEDAAAAAAAAREAASRREALRQLEEAAVANSAVFFAALATARDHGVEKRDIARCHALRSSMGL